MAVEVDDAVIVRELLNAGAKDVNAEIETSGGDARFPLVNYGAYNGNLEIVKALCAQGADIRKLSYEFNPEGAPILESVLSGGNRYGSYRHTVRDVSDALDRQRRTEIFRLLLARGAKYEPHSKEGHSLLCAACEADFLEVTGDLLQAGVPPNAKPEWLDYPYEYSPLDAAVSNDDIALIKILIQHGASPRDSHSEPPILYVRSPETARLLLEHGADIHAVQQRGKHQGFNALNYACQRENTKVVSFLIERGLDVNAGGPIREAALYGGVEIVRLLLQHGAKVGPKSSGSDALAVAIGESHFDSAQLLLRYGADVNATEDRPLTEAVLQGDPSMVLDLLKRGATVNAGRGEALLMACADCDEDLVAILLRHGADPRVQQSDGTTAFQAAHENEEDPGDAEGIIALLKEYGAKP